MSHYRSDNFKFSQAVYCLPSSGAYKSWLGKPCELPDYVIPSDIPTLLPESSVKQFTTQPEQVLTQFLEVNPQYMNPRDIGKILFHSKDLSPFAVSLLLFNSIYSSNALVFSFISAIDLDCVSIVDAIRFITQKVAIPAKAIIIVNLAEAFSNAYGLRNQLEWPNMKIIQSLFCATIRYCFLHSTNDDISFHSVVDSFSALEKISPAIIEQISQDLKKTPPAIYFTSAPINSKPNEQLSGDVEHEGRFRSSWKSYFYYLENNKLISKDSKSSSKIISEISLDSVNASQKNLPKKPYCMFLQRIDNREFGKKMKEGVLRDSPRTSYTLAFKDENELLLWISSINCNCIEFELQALN